MAVSSPLVVEFCGDEVSVQPGTRFSVGRDADLVVDDNAYLHRRIVEFAHDRGFWWIHNVGSRLAVTVCAEAGRLQSWVGPGSSLPVVLPELSLLFSAGDTTYELGVRAEVSGFEPVRGPEQADSEPGNLTLGAVELTASQLLLILALAENTLRRSGTGTSDLPTNVRAAARLGWSVTTFNRKLDNVCDKYDRAGVKGMRGGPGRLATQRRARLVEYAVAARIVTTAHLALLDDLSGDRP
jgi:hypothetical protein